MTTTPMLIKSLGTGWSPGSLVGSPRLNETINVWRACQPIRNPLRWETPRTLWQTGQQKMDRLLNNAEESLRAKSLSSSLPQ